MYVSWQTLTPDSRTRVLGEATTFGDEWLEHEARKKREHKIALFPTGSQVGPTTVTLSDVFLFFFFFFLISDVFLKDLSKHMLRLSRLADIEQGEKKTPSKFLNRLWEALHKFTEVDLKITEGETILKNRFLTKSAPDICCKLWKQVFGQNQSLDNLLQLAQMEHYNGEYEDENRQKKKEPVERLKPQQWLLDLLWKSLRKMPRVIQVKRDGLGITVERMGILSRIALRHLSCPWLQVQSAKDHMEKRLSSVV